VTPSQQLARDLVSAFPLLGPIMLNHLEDQEGELLPYLFMADVARWANSSLGQDPDTVARLVDWLEREFAGAEPAEKDLIGLGFVEAIPARPDGAALLMRLGPGLTEVAGDLGLLPTPLDHGGSDG
jgi:hypothetical protein